MDEESLRREAELLRLLDRRASIYDEEACLEAVIVGEGKGRRWYEISGWVMDGQARAAQNDLDQKAKAAED